MKRTMLLTSSGLSGSLTDIFMRRCGKKPGELRILLVPTAGIETDGAREGLAVCLYELGKMGIRSENVLIYNLELLLSKGYQRTYSAFVEKPAMVSRLLTPEEAKSFDAVFVSGGDTNVLCREMRRTGFDEVLKAAVNAGLVYVGISAGLSAGRMFAAGHMNEGMHFIPNSIVPHWNGERMDDFPKNGEDILLSDGQAVYIEDDRISLA